MKIEYRLSTVVDVRGMSEILLTARKRSGKKVITMRAKPPPWRGYRYTRRLLN